MYDTDTAERFREELGDYLAELRDLLCSKNAAYGDSALNPVNIFSDADAETQLAVQLDHKLSRLMRGDADQEDTITDVIGYCVLMKLANRRQAKRESAGLPPHSEGENNG